jgi:hypothetical protein
LLTAILFNTTSPPRSNAAPAALSAFLDIHPKLGLVQSHQAFLSFSNFPTRWLVTKNLTEFLSGM